MDQMDPREISHDFSPGDQFGGEVGAGLHIDSDLIGTDER